MRNNKLQFLNNKSGQHRHDYSGRERRGGGRVAVVLLADADAPLAVAVLHRVAAVAGFAVARQLNENLVDPI